MTPQNRAVDHGNRATAPRGTAWGKSDIAPRAARCGALNGAVRRGHGVIRAYRAANAPLYRAAWRRAPAWRTA